MRAGLTLLLLFAALLSGCAGTPQSREAGSTMEVSLLAAGRDGDQLRLTAAAQGEAGPLLCQGTGPTPAAALEDLTGRGEQVVSLAHVEHLLLLSDAAPWLPELLDYAFRDPQQSTETQLWVVDGRDPKVLFSSDRDVTRRMEVLKAQGRHMQGFCPVTLRETAGALARGEPVLLPRLDPGSLTRSGAVLWTGQDPAARLDREEALGAALLLGRRIQWTASDDGRSWALQLVRCSLLPQWRDGRLDGLRVRCVLEGSGAGGAGSPGRDERMEKQVARQIDRAVRAIRQAGAGDLLLGRAGLTAPWRWQTLSAQWPEGALPDPVEIRVAIRKNS